MNKSIARKKYLRYFAAAVFSALASCIYTLGDTIIIGQYEGDVGIKALNIILPVYMLFYALGLLFGMGAGIMVSYLRGKKQSADEYFSVAFFTLVALSVVIMIVSEIFFEPIMTFLGAEADTMPHLNAYGRYVTRGTLVFTLMPFMNSVMRNDNAPVLVTIGVVTSCFLNVVLDYLFVFTCDMGMQGAGLATLVCTGGQMLLSATHLASNKCSIKLTLKGLRIGKLLTTFKGGFASFVAEVSASIFMVIMNRQLLIYIAAGVEIYAVVANVVLVVNSILNGAAIASQPIISDAFGAQKHDEVAYYKKLGIITVALLGMALYVAVAIYPELFAYAFSSSPSPDFLNGVPLAVRIYMLSTLFYGFNMLYISYFQAVLRANLASAFNFLRGILFSFALVFVLPVIEANAIWAVVPLSEALTLAIIVVFVFKTKKKTPKFA